MKKLLTIVCLSCTVLIAWASPAAPVLRTLSQPDGTTFEAYIRGDEFLLWVESADGYTLLKDEQKWYTYAVIDEKGQLVPSEVRYQSNHRSRTNSDESSFLSTLPKRLFFSPEQIPLRVKGFVDKRVTPPSTPKNLRNSSETTQARKAIFANTTVPSTGERKMLAIILKFQEEGYNKNLYTPEFLSEMLNEDPMGFRSYYQEVSYGKLDIVSTVYEYTSPLPMSNYVDSCKNQVLNIANLIFDIFSYLDNQNVDLKEFDTNSDGILDVIGLFHSGRSAQATGDLDHSITTHMFNVAELGNADSQFENPRVGGVRVGAYCIQSQFLSNIGEEKETIGSIAHEFGHILGAPDYYGTGAVQTDGNGPWDIMALGIYNGEPAGQSPAHFNSYQKVQFDWMSFSDLTEAKSITDMADMASAPVAYRIAYKGEDEMFVLENRQKKNFDSALPGSGLLIYRIDHKLICDHVDLNNINVDGPMGMGTEITHSPYATSIYSPEVPFKNNLDFTPTTTPAMVGKFGYEVNFPLYNIVENDELISFEFLNDPTSVDTAEQCSWRVWNNNGSLILSGSVMGKQVEVYNLYGSLISRFQANANEITLPTLSAGIYCIRIDNSTSTVIL